MILMKPFVCTGKLLSSSFHAIPFDPAHSTILQLHCGPDFSKEVSEVILMKPFLCTGKLSSSFFHPIPINPAHSTILLLHCQLDLSKEVSKVILMKPFLCIGRLLSSDFHPILIIPTHSKILLLHCQPNFRKEVTKVILMKQCLYFLLLPNTHSNLHPIASILQGDGYIVQIKINIALQLMLMKLPYRLYHRWLL